MLKNPTYEQLEQRVKELQKEANKGKRTEEALGSMHRKLQATFDAIQEIMNVVDLDFNLTDVNDILIKAFGLPDKKSVLGRKCFEVLKGREDTCPNCAVAEVYQTKAAAYRMSASEDEISTGGRSFEIFAYPIIDRDGNLSGAVGFVRDITERKLAEEALKKAHDELEQKVQERTAKIAKANEQLKREIQERKLAEEELRKSKEQFQVLVESSSDWIWEVDRNGVYTYVSPKVEEILGYKPEEVVGKTPFDLMPAEEAERIAATFKGLIGRREPIVAMENVNLDKDGRRVVLETSGVPVLDAAGNVHGYRGVDRDITLRKKTEEALRESEEKYRALIETTHTGYLILDEAGRVIDANPEYIRLSGHQTMDEIVGRSVVEWTAPHDYEKNAQEVKKCMENGFVRNLEIDYIDRDGKITPIEINAKVVKIEDGQRILSVCRDITERKQVEEEKKVLEAKLQQAQKMEAIGTLAGGIAHDFNNLLMGIQGHASLLMLHIDSDHPHFERLKGIQDMVQTGANLTNQLLGFARGGKYEVKPTDLNELVKQSREMFDRTQKNIEINRKYQKGIWPVEVDRGQIHQVLLNLYVNAWHAMSGGGYIYIETSNVMLDENDTKPFNVKLGKYVKISVADTGAGMDKATQKKIFDPFFTTKEMSRGTGLGLASVYGIIKGHGGYIEVESKKGEGTTFSIYLPASERKVEKAVKTAEQFIKGTGTVLLVDDEDVILEVGRVLLEAMGYQVLIAKGGEEAIEVYKKNLDEIDIVVLDMVMPNMGGGEAYDRMKEINPDIKVLLSSGYSIDGEATKILERGCNGFIQKPFNMAELSAKIREVLDK